MSLKRLRLAAAAPLLVAMLLAALPGCGSSRPEVPGGLPDYDPQLALRLVEEEGAVILDVRTSAEFRSAHVEGARNIEVGELPGRLEEVNFLVRGDKQHPIVLYCSVGGRAAAAKRILLAAGYDRVTNLGGLRDWPGR